jgi:hypothetical protein
MGDDGEIADIFDLVRAHEPQIAGWLRERKGSGGACRKFAPACLRRAR